jgi:hypothetical protein
MLTCSDCPLPYGDPGWCDAVVPNDVWGAIAPEGGVICLACMSRRAVRLGLDNIPLKITSGPWSHELALADQTGFERGYRAAKAEGVA